MENLFSVLTEILNGIFPSLLLLNNWLLNDGLIFGMLIIVLPLIGKLINIIIKIRR